MGYYCTVPQCTSLAGKTKNVKFHRFPRDVDMANKWNNILKRGKPYTKYSKVCSLHFTQADYNVTTMGQWKTLSKDAIPSQNLPRLNPDGSVMVIRKSRTVKREIKREGSVDRELKFSPPGSAHLSSMDAMSGADAQDGHLAYRFHSLNALANVISPHHAANQTQPPLSTIAHPTTKPKKQDAIMQTDPIQDEADLNNSYASDNEEAKSFESEIERYQGQYQKDYKEGEQEQPPPPTYQQQENSKMADLPKDYTKSHDDYIPQTNDEYNKEAERYALDRKRTNYHPKNDYQKHHFDKTDYPKLYEKVNHESYGKMDEGYHSKHVDYQKSEGFKGHSDFSKGENGLQKNDYGGMVYGDKEFQRDGYITYQNGYPDAADLLRSQQHSLQMLQEQHRITENQNFFTESHIKQENDLAMDDDKYAYERAKEQIELAGRRGARLMDHLQHTLKQEPDLSVQPHGSPYYPANAHSNVPGGYYEGGLPRPGPELLIAKQNALAAHTQLWQNTMKRPFYYSESPHYTGTPTLLHRYEDLSRILQ